MPDSERGNGLSSRESGTAVDPWHVAGLASESSTVDILSVDKGGAFGWFLAVPMETISYIADFLGHRAL
jgi:hypothetical protein